MGNSLPSAPIWEVGPMEGSGLVNGSVLLQYMMGMSRKMQQRPAQSGLERHLRGMGMV